LTKQEQTTLAEVRRMMGVTQKQLAALAGMPQPVVSRLEGATDIWRKFASVKRCLEALGCKVEVTVEVNGKHARLESI
jgi:predicted transcriptional regulator